MFSTFHLCCTLDLIEGFLLKSKYKNLKTLTAMYLLKFGEGTTQGSTIPFANDEFDFFGCGRTLCHEFA